MIGSSLLAKYSTREGVVSQPSEATPYFLPFYLATYTAGYIEKQGRLVYDRHGLSAGEGKGS